MTDCTLVKTNFTVDSEKILSTLFYIGHAVSESQKYSLRAEDTNIPDKGWHLLDLWMDDEREADDDIRNGRFDTVNTVEELFALFDGQKEKSKKAK